MNGPDIAQPKARNWSRRKRARPGEIITAALSVFAEKGFAATRMEDIAARAGVTKGTIYLYFPSKDELFKSLARETVSKALNKATLDMASFADSPRHSLVRALGAIAAFLHNDEHAALPKIIIAESGNFPELADFWRIEVIEKVMAVLGVVYDKGVTLGQFRPLPRDMVVRLCVAPIILGVIWRTTFSDPHDPIDTRKLFETHINILLNGLLTPESAYAPR